jgi:hypothetical protein
MTTKFSISNLIFRISHFMSYPAVQMEFKVAASIPLLIGQQGLLNVGSIPTFGDLRICDANKSEDFVVRLLVGVYGSPAVDDLDVKVSEWRALLSNR